MPLTYLDATQKRLHLLLTLEWLFCSQDHPGPSHDPRMPIQFQMNPVKHRGKGTLPHQPQLQEHHVLN